MEKNDGCDVYIEGEGVELNSMWAIGPAFIIFLGGVLSSSIYLASYTYGQFEEGKDASVAPAPELYFDSEAKSFFLMLTQERSSNPLRR